MSRAGKNALVVSDSCLINRVMKIRKVVLHVDDVMMKQEGGCTVDAT